MDPITSVALQYGGLGIGFVVVVSFYRHVTRVTLPKLVEDARAERKELLAAFRAEMAAEREAHGRHVEAIVGRMDALEGDVAEIKGAIVSPHRLRVYAPDDTDPAA